MEGRCAEAGCPKQRLLIIKKTAVLHGFWRYIEEYDLKKIQK